MSHRNNLPSPLSPVQNPGSLTGLTNSGHPTQRMNNAVPVANSRTSPTNSGRTARTTNTATTVAQQNASPASSRILGALPRSIQSSPSSINLRTDWLPFTLRWYSMLLPIIATLSFGIVLSYLCWYSQRNYGLGKDDGSSAILFGWRFTPTLVAVLYTQLAVILFEDSKRTEPFARLAKPPPGGAAAYGTLLQTPKAWWAVFIDMTFRHKRVGKPSFTLVCSTVVYVLALLIISPLSSALLASEEMVVPQNVDFMKLVPQDGVQFPMNATRETYFRTLSALTRNISTSTWVSDGSITLPFWPATEKMQLSPEIVSSYGSWQAETITYTHNFACRDMTLVSADIRNRTYVAVDWHGYTFNGTQPMVSYVLTSTDKCKYELDIHPAVDIAYNGGVMWSNATTFLPTDPGILNIDQILIDPNVSSHSPYARLKTSTECNDRDIILLSTPWPLPHARGDSETLWANRTYHRSPNFRMRGLLCDSTYTRTPHKATALINSGSSTSIQNTTNSNTTSSLLPRSLLNTTRFQELALGDQWKRYVNTGIAKDAGINVPVQRADFGPRQRVQIPGFSGPGIILGTLTSWNVTALIDDPTLSERAGAIKGRFFAENIRDSLETPQLMQAHAAPGITTMIEERVIVLKEIGIALATLFSVSFVLLLLVLWSSRLSRRPLNLPSDPSSTVGLSTLLNPQLTSMSTLKRMHNARKCEIYGELSKEGFFTSGNTLYEDPNAKVHNTARKFKQHRNWRPLAIQLKGLFALGTFLAMVLACLLTLNAFSLRSQLYQKAFIYQADLSKYGLSISTFAPISIGPSVISVAVTLWWDQLDMTLRLLQPYVSMSQAPTAIRSGAGLTYRSKTWMGAAVKAARHRHWILFMVALGSTLCQVLTVSMSALFERRPDNVLQQVKLDKTLEARQLPVITTIDVAAYSIYVEDYLQKLYHPEAVLDNIYRDNLNNWLYSATVELALGGSNLAWTRDEWSFVPIDLSHVPSYVSNQSTFGDVSKSTNVTLRTSAMRAWLACEQIDQVTNTSAWLREMAPDDIPTLTPDSNVTGLSNGYVLPRLMFEKTRFATGVVSAGNLIQCCNNGTDSNPRRAVIGNWSPQLDDVDADAFPYPDRLWPIPFVTKWIVGNPRSFRERRENTLFFQDPPSLQAAFCKPVIDFADAVVEVDQETNAINSYELASAPESADSAWSDVFLRHDISGSHKHFNKNYSGELNITTSFGVLFLDAIFGAFERDAMGSFEDISDNAFNIRDTNLGTNLDLMTYSMYSLAGKDAKALLNYTTLTTHANRTFQTFFQHFVNNRISTTEGNWAYQKIGDRAIEELGRPVDENGTAVAERQYLVGDANRTVTASVSKRIQVLHMNTTATYLSAGIVIWLIATAAIVTCIQRRYTGSMLRNVEVIADVLVLVAGSENFLSLVQERGIELKKDNEVKTKLGWFKDCNGEVRWGIEVVGGRNPVEWVAAPRKDYL